MYSKLTVGIIGSGAMGAGIAQVAATAGHPVIITDTNPDALKRAEAGLASTISKLVEKSKITPEKGKEIISLVKFSLSLNELAGAGLVIEAIIENLEVKQKVFADLDKIVPADCMLASNTSSLSITSIASAVKDASRVIGIHFFNPAPLMPLVEIIPGIATKEAITQQAKQLIADMGKTVVLCKDTPGFIVNRIARPFYGEAMRIYEEGIADIATIDWALKSKGGFKMGPFELTDLIGHDVNYTVTETVWKQFYFDPRFKPAICQKRLVEGKMYGKKSGRGFYDYAEGAAMPQPLMDEQLAELIFLRVIAMLVNEAADAVYMGIGTKEDIDLAMTKGVNYPKGLLRWGEEIGLDRILKTLQDLHALYAEDRYRPCVLLKRAAIKGTWS